MRHAPAQAAADAEAEDGGAGLMAGGHEEIEARHEQQHLRQDGRREIGHVLDRRALLDGHGEARAAGTSRISSRSPEIASIGWRSW
jgi:hypothetical protein